MLGSTHNSAPLTTFSRSKLTTTTRATRAHFLASATGMFPANHSWVPGLYAAIREFSRVEYSAVQRM